MVKELTSNNFEKEIINSDLPVVIDFYADWCGPCQMMKSIVEAVSKVYLGKIKFMKVDTQAESELAMKFGIQGIPTFVVIEKGREVGRIIGYMDELTFKQKINQILKK